MFLKEKGLLSDCEQMFTPMSSDKEGHLRGGFGKISVASVMAANQQCTNDPCVNSNCSNYICGNGDCTNKNCDNQGCFNITKKPEEPTTPKPSIVVSVCGIL